MSFLTIDKDTCNKCGICAASCPGIISFRKNEYPDLWPGITDEMCDRCGHCVAICPTGSLMHKDIPLNQCLSIDKNLAVSLQQCIQHVKSRRSIREFRDKLVPGELIKQIIETARYAPTASNRQEVQWLIINERSLVRRLSGIGADWLRWASKITPGMEMTAEGLLKGMEHGYDGFLLDAPALVIAFAEKDNLWAATDCVLATGYFDLIAHSAGLGCCWGGFFLRSASTFGPMIEALALPEGCAPYGCLMVGYPKYGYKRIPLRKEANIRINDI